MTEDLPEIRKHWEKEGISFDAIYTGFIASQEQLDYIKDIIDSRLNDEGLVFVDPAMADHGEFYNGFDQEFADAMGELVISSINLGKKHSPKMKCLKWLKNLKHLQKDMSS